MPLPVGPQKPGKEKLTNQSNKGLPLPDSTTRKNLRVFELNVPPLAIWSDRALATLIDLAIFFTPLIVGILLAASASPDVERSSLLITIIFSFIVSIAIWFGQVFLEGTRGQTIGKIILGLVVVRRSDALVLGFEKALSRNFVKLVLDMAPAGMGILTIIRDTVLHQSQADQNVDSIVLYNERKHAETEETKVENVNS